MNEPTIIEKYYVVCIGDRHFIGSSADGSDCITCHIQQARRFETLFYARDSYPGTKYLLVRITTTEVE